MKHINEIVQPSSVTEFENEAWVKVNEIIELCKSDKFVVFKWHGALEHGSARFRGWRNPETGDDETRYDRYDTEGQPVPKWYGFKSNENILKVSIKSKEELYMMIGNPACKESPYATANPETKKVDKYQYSIANPSLNQKSELENLKRTEEAGELYRLLMLEDAESKFIISTLLGNFDTTYLKVEYTILHAAQHRSAEFISIVNDKQREIKSIIIQLKQHDIIQENAFKWQYIPTRDAKPMHLGYNFDEVIRMVSQDTNLQNAFKSKLDMVKEGIKKQDEKEKAKSSKSRTKQNEQ